MFIACDAHNQRVDIESADPQKVYFCPICQQKLKQVRPSQKRNYFSHIGLKSDQAEYVRCSDKWKYCKTEWHLNWQKKFPMDCREYLLDNGKEKHFADVLVNDVVIEFQHSSISIKEFYERNEFYKSCGYKIVWIFDLIEEFESEKIYKYDGQKNKFHWGLPPKMFRELLLDNEVVVLFQCSNLEDKNTRVLARITHSYKNFQDFYIQLNHTYSIPEFVQRASCGNFPFWTSDTFRITKDDIEAVQDGNTILDIWKNDYRGIIVENLVTGDQRVIYNKNGSIEKENNRIIGKYSNRAYNGKYSYKHSDKKYVVWDAEHPIWRIIKIITYK